MKLIDQQQKTRWGIMGLTLTASQEMEGPFMEAYHVVHDLIFRIHLASYRSRRG